MNLRVFNFIHFREHMIMMLLNDEMINDHDL